MMKKEILVTLFLVASIIVKSQPGQTDAVIYIFAKHNDKDVMIYDASKVELSSPTTGATIEVKLVKTKFGDYQYYVEKVSPEFTTVTVTHPLYSPVTVTYKDEYYASPFGETVKVFRVDLKKKLDDKPGTWCETVVNKTTYTYLCKPNLVGLVPSDTGKTNLPSLKEFILKNGFEILSDSSDIWILKLKKGCLKEYKDSKLAALQKSPLVNLAGPLLGDNTTNPEILVNRITVHGNLPDDIIKKEGLTELGGPLQGGFKTYKFKEGTGLGVLKTAARIEKSGDYSVEPGIVYSVSKNKK